MPFNKKNKKKSEEKDNSLAKALGFSQEIADKILPDVHEILHESRDHSKALLKLNEKYDDNQLLFAAYAYGRMVEHHSDGCKAIAISGKDLFEGLEKAVREFVEQKGK